MKSKKPRDFKKVDALEDVLEGLQTRSIQLDEADVSLLKEKNFITDDTNLCDIEEVLNIIKKILKSENDSKHKLYMMSSLLCANKHEFIKALREDINELRRKICHQRIYINKIIDSNNKLKKQKSGFKKPYNNSNFKKPYNPNYRNPNYRKPESTYNKYDYIQPMTNTVPEEPKKKFVVVKRKNIQS